MKVRVNTIWNILEAAIGFLVTIVVTQLIIKHFGMRDYGLFVLLSMLSGYGVISLFDLGMTGAVVAFAARYKNQNLLVELKKLWTFSLLFYLFIASITVMVVIVIVSVDFGGILTRVKSSGYQFNLLYPAILLTFLSFFSYASVAFLQAFELYRPLQIVNILGHLLRLIASFYLLDLHDGLYFFLWAIVLIKILQTFLLVVILLMLVKEFRCLMLPNLMLIKEWARYSLILFSSALVGFCMNMVDKVLIAAKLPFLEVGRYDVANKPANGLRMGVSVLYSALEPATVRVYSTGGKPSVRRLFNKSTFYISSIMIPLIVVSFFNMKTIFNVWLGYIDYDLIQLSIASAFFLLIVIHASVANVMLVAVGAAKKILPIQIISALLVLILMVSTINLYGLWGCVLAIFAGYTLSSILILKYFFYFFGYKSARHFKNAFLRHLITLSISALISYAGVLVFFGAARLIDLIFSVLIELTICYGVIYFFVLKRNEKVRFWL
jgi:O-antigen/teichoic acid export membrane protein